MAAACCPTCKRRLPTPRKAAKPKPSANVKAFLKLRFPEGTAGTGWKDLPANWREVQDAMSPAARAQFAYGSKDRLADDAAVLYVAGQPALVELAMAA